MMFMYSEAPFLDIRYRTQIHYGAEINTPGNIGRLAEQAAGGRSYHLEPYGNDGDVIFQLERSKRTPETRKVLFTGTGRCGTQYISNLFTANGIDIGHELVGVDGVASHFFAYDADWHWFAMGQPVGYIHLGEHRSDYTFENIIHVVREPLACIASIKDFFHDCDWVWFEAQGAPSWVKPHSLLSAMYAYVAMNEKAETQATLTIRIEDIDIEFPSLAEGLFNIKPNTLRVPRANQSPTRPQQLTWEDLEQTSKNLTFQIRELSRRYGYGEK